MATPLSNDALLAALKAEFKQSGTKLIEVPGWRQRCRCHTGSHELGGPKVRPWGPFHGSTCHITAGNLGTRTVLQYIASIINGDPDVPIKSQFVTAPNGDCYLNSGGRCNHAGKVSQTSKDMCIAGSWSLSKWEDHRGDSIDGNTFLYGIENIAAVSMSSAQRTTSVLICAAIARAEGWNGRESVGHGEISSARGYADPNLNMGLFRKDVFNRLAQPTVPVPVPPPAEPTTEPAPVPVVQSTTAKIMTQNLWGYGGPQSSSTQAKRLPIFLDQVEEYMPDAIAVQELSDTESDRKVHEGGKTAYTPREYVDKKLKDRWGYDRVAAGSDGRFIYVNDSIEFIKGKTILMDPMYQGDDKQAAAAIMRKAGIKFDLVSGHTENEGVDDKYRVGQVHDLIRENYAWILDEGGVKKKNTIYAGDWNDRVNILKEFNRNNFWDAALKAPADHRHNEQYKSAGQYLRMDLGERIDIIAVHELMPVLRFEQIVNFPCSDHNGQIITIRLTA